MLGKAATQAVGEEDVDDSMDDSMDGSEESWYTDESDEDAAEEGVPAQEKERHIEVVEKMRGSYECPTFKLSKKEENHIQEPWRQAVIVKLLGTKIGFKALEDRLRQMWVRNGIITMVDLGNEYFLVDLSNEEDYAKTLEEGPWLIYNHYLIVRRWTPNFDPMSESIETVAAWVRLSRLPIEYYDSKVLRAIGNQIGKTVRIDDHTLTQARGKYARLCVEVDLTKPLLAMFELQDRFYTVEYEGLHLLCMNCGRFGHYMEGCPDKARAPSAKANSGVQPPPQGESGAAGTVTRTADERGPWVVVQKQRQPRRQKDGGAGGPGGANPSSGEGAKSTGSRFQILNDEDREIANDSGEKDQGNLEYKQLVVHVEREKSNDKGKKVIDQSLKAKKTSTNQRRERRTNFVHFNDNNKSSDSQGTWSTQTARNQGDSQQKQSGVNKSGSTGSKVDHTVDNNQQNKQVSGWCGPWPNSGTRASEPIDEHSPTRGCQSSASHKASRW